MTIHPQLKELPLVILCGGKSSRMGEDKALLPFGSYSSLVQYQYERLKPYFKIVYLSSKINKFDFLDSDDNIIYDEGETFSPMVALQTILKTVSSQEVFILTVDTPFVTIGSISKIYENINSSEIAVANSEKLHNLCGIYNKSVLCKIEECLSKDIHKIGYLLKISQTKTVDFFDENEFLNLNKKEDYLKALSIIS